MTRARRGTWVPPVLAMEMVAKYEPMSGLWLVDHIGEAFYCHIAKTLGYFDPMVMPKTYRPPLQVPGLRRERDG